MCVCFEFRFQKFPAVLQRDTGMMDSRTAARQSRISVFYDAFYEKLFEKAPDTRALFEGNMVRQSRALVKVGREGGGGLYRVEGVALFFWFPFDLATINTYLLKFDFKIFEVGVYIFCTSVQVQHVLIRMYLLFIILTCLLCSCLLGLVD